jgi:hypothetical protein
VVQSFQPTIGATVSRATTSVSSRVLLGGQPSAPGQRFQVRIYNAGPDTAFIRFGDSTVTATSADVPIPSGAIEVMSFTVPEQDVTGAYMAAITASGTATVYFTTGVGI